jgi:hypothetical protein
MKKKPVMAEATWRSVGRLVLYLAIEDGRDYADTGKPRDHIFRDVMRVARWLDNNQPH